MAVVNGEDSLIRYMVSDKDLNLFENLDMFYSNSIVCCDILHSIHGRQVNIFDNEIGDIFKNIVINNELPETAIRYKPMVVPRPTLPITLNRDHILYIVGNRGISQVSYNFHKSRYLNTIKEQIEFFNNVIDDLTNQRLVIIPVDYTFRCSSCEQLFAIMTPMTNKNKPSIVTCPHCKHLAVSDAYNPSTIV